MAYDEEATEVVEVPNGGWDARLRLFRVADEVDTYALLTKRYLVLVDTMSTPTQAEALMGHLTAGLADRQLLVINSHADYDHCWGNAIFATPHGRYPAPIIAHRLADERLRSDAERAVLAAKQAEEPRFAGVRLVPPTISFEGVLRIDCGDLILELLPAPGHSPDQVVVWIPELRLLLATDAAEHPIPYVHDPATLPQLRATLQDLLNLNPALVIPCHGGTTSPELLRRNVTYFDVLETRVRVALTSGRVVAEMADRPDLPELVEMPIAEMAQIAGIDAASVSDFYRASHLLAVRGMLILLSHHADP